jgi:asparagine synthase (glutamine-hydrolysing)
MSGIAGLYNRDGRPLEPDLVQRMTCAISNWGRDGEGHYVDGPVGLGHRMLCTTPQSLREVQPLTDETGKLCLVFDGRVDNRDEVRAAVEAKGAELRTETDGELALRAYECWGDQCPTQIIGDFAFAIWDKPKRKLFCVRDPLGVRPFYYYSSGAFLAFASDPAALFALPQVHKRLNLEAMVDYLINNQADSQPTEFEHLYRLRPAHTLTVSEGLVRCQQYWDIDPARLLLLRRPEEYEETLREVLTTAVRDRMRSNGRVGVVFSGGLDSSSILCLAEDLRARGKCAAEVRAYSAVFDGQPYDESPYMRSVREQWGTEICWVRPQPPRPIWTWPEACRRDTRPLGSPMGFLAQTAFDAAAHDGTRTLVSGLGGDDFMEAVTGLAAELLLAGHPIRACRYIAKISAFHSMPLISGARSALIKPLLGRVPRSLRKIYRLFRPRSTVSWLSSHQRQAVRERSGVEPWYMRGRHFHSPSRWAAYNAVHNGYRVEALEWWSRVEAAAGVEVRHPFMDRRLVELASSIPDEEKSRGGEPKGLLRAAVGTRLPEPIRRRPDKADFAAVMNYCLAIRDVDSARSLLADPILAQLGLIDVDAARETYSAYCERYGGHLADKRGPSIVWSLLSLEAWARIIVNGSNSEILRRYDHERPLSPQNGQRKSRPGTEVVYRPAEEALSPPETRSLRQSGRTYPGGQSLAR